MNTVPVNPLHHFFDSFEKAAHAECAIFEETRWTYGDLLEAIAQDSKALAQSGVRAGEVVVATGEFGLRQLSLLFALARLGAIIVPLPEIEELEMVRCAEIAEAAHLVGVAQDGSWTSKRTGRIAAHPLIKQFLLRGEAGLIVFTSGSTGARKGVLHSLPRLLAKYRVSRKTFRTLAFLRIDHLGGLNTVLYALSNHGAVVFPRRCKVDEICRLIERHKIELLPSTPSFLRLLLLSGCQARYDLSSLQLITYGTELMPLDTLRSLRRSFPRVPLQQTYGLSELGVLRSKSLDSESAWVKLGGEDFQTRVVDGTLWIKANSAMEGYLNHPNPFREDGWFETGDKIEVQGEYVRFLGRESEVINVAGEKVFPLEVENFLLGLENVKDVAVSSEPNPLLGQMVTARVVLAYPEPEAEARQRIRRACRQSLRPFMVPVKIGFLPELEYSERYKKVRSEAGTNVSYRTGAGHRSTLGDVAG
jgi:long-chain acyl-CoA synthetase